MFCKYCGSLLIDGSDKCLDCGMHVENVVFLPEENVKNLNIPAPRFSINAIVGFVVSLVGIIAFAVPSGIIGLVFSSIGLKKTLSNQYKGLGMAIAGLVVSILDIVFGVYLLICF